MNIIRLYNQNRKQIFIVILIIASIIFAIRFANYLVMRENEENLNSLINSSSTGSTTTINQSQQSAISSSSVSNKEYKDVSELIDNFIKYCNEGNATKAYELLSTDCKNVMFPTLEYFVNNYMNAIFSENKIYSIKNWKDNTYRISITENILATGKSNNGITIQDYVTIVKEDGNSRLNINSFIRRTSVNKKKSNNNLNIEVIYKDTYMDYVIYTFKVTNKTEKTIAIDSGESTNNMYILDNNNLKYMFSSNEIINANLVILPYATKEIQIKYFVTNISTRTIEAIVFNDIILDLDSYKNNNLNEEYTDRTTIKIEL